MISSRGGDRRGDAGRPVSLPPASPARWATTSESGERRFLDEVAEPAAEVTAVRAMAETIARRLSARPRHRERAGVRGAGSLVSLPYRYRSDDIDLDRTLEVLTERPVPDDTDIVVRERVRSRWAVALMVDVSGSMRGEKARIAAATVASLGAAMVEDELTVVAFWRDAVLVKPLGASMPVTQVLDDLLRIPAKGLTNVGFGLSVGLNELARSRSRRQLGILLSDSVHNAGPDPRPLAARFRRLHVLLEADGEHDADLARDLARLGRGHLAAVRGHREVAPALNRMLAS